MSVGMSFMNAFGLDQRNPGEELPLTEVGHKLFDAAISRSTYALDEADKLAGSIKESTAEEPVPVESKLAPNGKYASFFFDAGVLDGEQVWAWKLADFLHNQRAVLDNLAWALVRGFDIEMSKQEEKQLYFPLCNTIEDFKKMLKKDPLGKLPFFVQERLRATQPLLLGENAPHGILHWLDRIEIQDKHRSSLELKYRSDLDTNFHYVILDGDNREIGIDHFEKVYKGGDLVGRVELGRAFGKSKISTAEVLEFEIDLWLEKGDLQAEVSGFLEVLTRQIGLTIEMLMWGSSEDINALSSLRDQMGAWVRSPWRAHVEN